MGDEESATADLFGLPALHIMLGVVKLCVELEKVWPGFHEWPDTLHLVRENYFRKTLKLVRFF
jgi:hypothetical protein